MRHFALSAIGYDRPGIVAAVTERLLAHAVNIEDSQMTILRGHFAMTLLLGAPAEIDGARLGADLQEVRGQLGLDAISLNELAESDAADAEVASHVVTVYGGDHPGIVHAVCAVLAQREINIVDLTTHLVDADEGEALYVLMMEVALGGVAPEQLSALLEPVGREQAVQVSIQPLQHELL